MPADAPATLRCVSGDAILPWLDALARLRLQVFREWPYLYDGDETYERRYLQTYADASRSLMVLALNEGRVVGASSGLPMAEAEPAFQAPFRARGIDVAQVFYFGESVLDAGFRGQGLGHRFFDEREAFARQSGYAITTFCAVQRPADHPARPAHYRPLDAFWQGRGYRRQDGMLTRFSWQDIGDDVETAKPMQFWTRGL
ncbi:GNAT family N-acetyltransferase [Alcanivorax sp. JB21]|uniref:GNAT family N-acetyltransferase n=1 Tax=Alcanivorax limicola TaxID=2874102 RepID=UPI001CBEFBF3|nr:GNAT family N-acetyltransferase [Alcanivorax limicola]MBZ2188724.1 GNAT family N-acetyltransferase [Alcanivorax limicola]